MSATTGTRHAVTLAALLAVATVVAHGRSCGAQFLHYDDPQYVTENKRVLDGLSWSGVGWALTAREAANWHPLAWLSHQADVSLFGLDPRGHHASSVALHAANTVLLFLVLRWMTGTFWRSGLVAALFGLHPLHVESVAWVAERKDVLAGFFWLLTMGAHCRLAERPTLGRYLMVVATCALAMLSKPVAVTLPLALLLLDLWPLRRWETRPFRSLLLEKLPLLALSAATSVLTYSAQRQGGALTQSAVADLPARVANALHAYWAYLLKILWPADLSVFYPHTMSPEPWRPIAVYGLALAAVAGAALWQARRRPHLAFGLLWFVGTLVPMSGLVQAGAQGMADRYTYLPLIGVFVSLAWAGEEAVARWPRAVPLAWFLATVMLATLSALTWIQSGYWLDGVALFSRAVRLAPGNTIAHANLGFALARAGRLDESNAAYLRALEMFPNLPVANLQLGENLERQGRLREAERRYREELRVFPANGQAGLRLAYLVARQGRVDEGIDLYSRYLLAQPGSADARNNLGFLLMQARRYAEARAQFQEALRLAPSMPEARANLLRLEALVAQDDTRMTW